MKKLLAFLITLNLIVGQASTAFAINSQTAQSYLQSATQTPWTTMGLSALGADASTSHIGTSYNTAIDITAPILALTSKGIDPRSYQGTDLIAKLKSFANNGQIGSTQALNDDIFGILALLSAGVATTDQEVASTRAFILQNQNANGGWGFQVGGPTDTNTTAAAVLALIASGLETNDTRINNAVNYVKTAQNADGGFNFDPQSTYSLTSDASSTAWVIWMFNRIGTPASSITKNGKSPINYLESLQNSSGYFVSQTGASSDAFTPNTTGYAAIALSGKYLPVRTISGGGGGNGGSVSFRIEGKQDTVCEGQVNATTAMDVIRNAKNQCGYTFEIKNTAYGPYLNRINTDEAAGLDGWLYLIDNKQPQVGANDYTMKAGEKIVWYYGKFDWRPCRMKSSQAEVSAGANVTVQSEYFDGSAWQKAANAEVIIGAQKFTSNSDGNTTITAPEGFYRVYCQGATYVRGEKIDIKFGTPTQTEISLQAEIVDNGTGGPGNQVISIIVNPSSINFGRVEKGQSSSKQFTIENRGNVKFKAGAQYSGSSAIGSNLKIDTGTVQNFSTLLNPGNISTNNLVLSIPSNWTDFGNRQGKLTFWAIAQ